MSKIFDLQVEINSKVLRLGNLDDGYERLEKIYNHTVQLLREGNDKYREDK